MFYYPHYIRGCFYEELSSIPLLQKQKAQLIDLRNPDTFSKSHLAGFINIPYSTLNSQLHRVRKNYPVYLLCDNGQKSEIAATDLCTLGYKAYSFIGGYHHYSYQIDTSLY